MFLQMSVPIKAAENSHFSDETGMYWIVSCPALLLSQSIALNQKKMIGRDGSTLVLLPHLTF